ncbi:sugar ABC transporter permease [Devosia pacifica]|uniref:Sugar ABC transporter permease n=1 Tax=Devosia pacifica TaxID=1335967 RepID=A0A918W076_9HYPH|nr:ABC transporter permease [Devosia pacifica]GHA39378.1 sugar ABC transporter permease [Devosia pacifica]
MHEVDVPPAATKSAGSLRRVVSAHTEEFLLAGVIVALIAVGGFLSPVFLSQYNITSVARQVSFDVMPALGQLLAVLAAGIDLSIGAVIRLAQMVSILLVERVPLPVAFLLVMACGAAVGLVNGLLVVKGRLEPFIVTLGTWTILDGLSLLVTGGRGIAANVPDAFAYLGRGTVVGIPVPTLIAALVVIIMSVVIHRSSFGRQLFSVGSNDLAAHYAGIKVARVRVTVFMLASSLAALTGFIMAARTGAFQPTTISSGGAGTELATIAAVVVGGARLSGGRGTVIGALLGATLTGVLFSILVLAGIDPYVQSLILGLIILGALLLSASRRSKS